METFGRALAHTGSPRSLHVACEMLVSEPPQATGYRWCVRHTAVTHSFAYLFGCTHMCRFVRVLVYSYVCAYVYSFELFCARVRCFVSTWVRSCTHTSEGPLCRDSATAIDHYRPFCHRIHTHIQACEYISQNDLVRFRRLTHCCPLGKLFTRPPTHCSCIEREFLTRFLTRVVYSSGASSSTDVRRFRFAKSRDKPV